MKPTVAMPPAAFGPNVPLTGFNPLAAGGGYPTSPASNQGPIVALADLVRPDPPK
jgi:hypothetical protein